MLGLLLTVALSFPPQSPTSPQKPEASTESDLAPASTENVTGLIDHLGLSSSQTEALHEALSKKDYRAAQKLLLDTLPEVHSSSQKRSVLITLGGTYFLDRDPMQAAIAWNKAAAIEPLPPKVRFSLAMAYVQTGHNDWAEHTLSILRQAEPANALYPFWLGRIAYDRQLYDSAIVHFRAALAIDPSFAKAHDNLGLSLFDVNQVDASIAEFKSAIALQASHQPHSPWPYLNLGIAYDFRGQTAEAILSFRQAIDADPGFAEAHYRLGNVLLKEGRLAEAVTEEKGAVALKGTFAEPHLVLSQLYRRLGRDIESKAEAAEYKRLHTDAYSPAVLPDR